MTLLVEGNNNGALVSKNTLRTITPGKIPDYFLDLLADHGDVIGGFILRLVPFNLEPDILLNKLVAKGLGYKLKQLVPEISRLPSSEVAILVPETSGSYLGFAVADVIREEFQMDTQSIHRIRRGQPSVVLGNDPIASREIIPITSSNGETRTIYARIPADSVRNKKRLAVIVDDVEATRATMKGSGEITNELFPNLEQIIYMSVFAKQHQITEQLGGRSASLVVIKNFTWHDDVGQAILEVEGHKPRILKQVTPADFGNK